MPLCIFQRHTNKQVSTFISCPLGNSPSLDKLGKRIEQKSFLLWQEVTELHQLFDGLKNIFMLRISQKVVENKKKIEKTGKCKAF